MATEPQGKLYYDGNCPMCTAFASHVDNQTDAPTIIDANTAPSLPATKEAVLTNIHLVESDGTLRVGPDAILTILAKKHPWLQPITSLFRYPGFRPIAEGVYRFVADRRTWWFGSDTSRIFWLFLITSLGFLSSILLTLPLWGSDRTYPLAPLHDSLTSLTPLSIALSGLLVLSLLIGLWSKKFIPYFCLTSAVLLSGLVLLDITRLQPWVWQYGVLLTLLSFWKPNDETRSTELLDAARFVVVGIYFWSGIQKFNIAFFSEVFPWFTEPLWRPFGEFGLPIMLGLGLLIPFIEAGFALGFLTHRFRKISLYGAAAMLTLVAACLMLGHGWNSSVWPWNFAIISMALALFVGSKDSINTILRRSIRNRFALVTIGFFIIMPAGNLVGITDHYLSWSLYSGHVPTAYLTAPSTVLHELAPRAELIATRGEVATLPFVRFSIATLNAVPYPEERVFLSLFSSLCATHPDVYPFTLTIETRPFFQSHLKTEQTYECSSLPQP
jgi:predicted DCC family thiol-disulfide oxidoreductase YuxK